MVGNIVVCTLMMWGLSAIAVSPLAAKFFKKALAENPDLDDASKSEEVDDVVKKKIQKVYISKFIQADVMVMSLAGFIAGLAGFPLIGLAWKAQAWPGLIAMIATSFFGYHLSGTTKIF
jgi:hypothetical protein